MPAGARALDLRRKKQRKRGSKKIGAPTFVFCQTQSLTRSSLPVLAASASLGTALDRHPLKRRLRIEPDAPGRHRQHGNYKPLDRSKKRPAEGGGRKFCFEAMIAETFYSASPTHD